MRERFRQIETCGSLGPLQKRGIVEDRNRDHFTGRLILDNRFLNLSDSRQSD